MQQVYDITRRLPPEIMTVGVFRDEHPKRVIEIVHRSGVKAAQLHGNESDDEVAEVAKAVPFVVKAFVAGSPRVAESARSPPTRSSSTARRPAPAISSTGRSSARCPRGCG